MTRLTGFVRVLACCALSGACTLLTELPTAGEAATDPTAPPPSTEVDHPGSSAESREASVADGPATNDGSAADTGRPDVVEASAPVCTKLAVGKSCLNESECCSGNCYANKCEGNGVGSKCAFDSNCTSRNCYANVCEGNGPGSKCAFDSNCTSNSCFANVCQ